MYTSIALFGFAAVAMAQGVTETIAAPGAPAPGCESTAQMEFSITTVNATTSTRRVKRQSSSGQGDDMGMLTIRLTDGVLISNRGDTGYIAANDQFQFDSPPQTGAIFTGGFSICPNNTLALGGSAIFYSCLSGEFSNLYSASQGQQCSEVFIETLGAGETSGGSGGMMSPSATPSATSAASSMSPSPVSSIADNQPQAATSAAAPGPSASVSQITDNQPQAPTAAPSPTPSPIYAAGAPATGANLALAGVALFAAAML